MQRCGPNVSMHQRIGSPHTSTSCSGRRAARLVPALPVDRHADAAELEHDVVARRDLGHRLPPPGEDLVALAGVRADAERAAEVVEDHRRVRHGAAQVDELGELGVEQPGVEADSPAAPSAANPRRKSSWPSRPGGGLVCDSRMSGLGSWALAWRMPRKRPCPASTCAARTSATSGRVRSAKPTMPATKPVGVGGDDELGLADRPERLRAVAAVAGTALDEHRLGEVRRRSPCRRAAPAPCTGSWGGPTGGGAGRRSCRRPRVEERVAARLRYSPRWVRESWIRWPTPCSSTTSICGRGRGEAGGVVAEERGAQLAVGLQQDARCAERHRRVVRADRHAGDHRVEHGRVEEVRGRTRSTPSRPACSRRPSIPARTSTARPPSPRRSARRVAPSACQPTIAACISGNTLAKAVDSYVAGRRRTAAGPPGTAPSRGRAAAGRRTSR